MAMGEDLYAVHINDNCGVNDEHTMPYLGTVNLDDIINGLIDSSFKGTFTFESCRLLRPSKTWFGNHREFSKDTRLLDAPFEIHMEMEKLMYKIGKYALEAYDIFEE